MPCTKTGFHGYLEPYDEYVYGDAFEILGVAYFRICQRSREPLFSKLHYTIHNWETFFDEDAIKKGGNATMICAPLSWTFYGYGGKEIK